MYTIAMRIIEPHTLSGRTRSVRPTGPSKKRRRILALLLLVFVVGISWLMLPDHSSSPQTSLTDSENTSPARVAGVQNGPMPYFTGEQFQVLYDSLAFPNTQPIITAPHITGNQQADARIRQIAESRGYKLRAIPVRPIIKTGEPGLVDDDLLQPKAYEAWLAIKNQAAGDNIPIKLNSGYRTIEWQRNYFVQNLRAAGVSTEDIIVGAADTAIVSIIRTIAPPGYSRHHTGYTIDLVCDDGTGRAFEFTHCFEWLSSDNYGVAKRFGWIPSYPDGVDRQGPEPEPWEYVWVGTETLMSQ